MAHDPTVEGGPSVFASFVDKVLEDEDNRRDSIEARATSLLTMSGTLVTLLLALASFVLGKDAARLNDPASERIVLAALAFVLSALLAVLIRIPQPTRLVGPVAFAAELKAKWSYSADDAMKTVVATQLVQLDVTQRSNDRRALLLLGASVVQVAAIGLLAWAVLSALG